MRILAVDIGTGTQDILLFDSSKTVENCIKMVMPSPTSIIAGQIFTATARGQSIIFSGTTMGGGPCTRALARHLEVGLKAYATPEAALTFNDNLDIVRNMGVVIANPDELPHTEDTEKIELKDLNLRAIRTALSAFNVEGHPDAIAVAVQDHGYSPELSNRRFRMEHLRNLVIQNKRLVSFAYMAHEIPDYLTRMKAVADSIDDDVPVLLMDTGVAAAIGALQDREVAQYHDLVIANLGNSHVITFHLHNSSIEGLFEHHTGAIDNKSLESMINRLVRGQLTNDEVYESGGHGAVVLGWDSRKHLIAVTGPRKEIITHSAMKIHLAVPHGDMMLAGCFGLVGAFALKADDWRDQIMHSLSV